MISCHDELLFRGASKSFKPPNPCNVRLSLISWVDRNSFFCLPVAFLVVINTERNVIVIHFDLSCFIFK